ncbi:hypothetical protein RJ641_003895 [Dillenia turbinata]|uniref:Isopenicillin N synthase-like Fe(2+) 2OG dioxygenase domain-containing protein n=1 Tax=Dillenia turbinata TaxID=194707 RepID=A0AAN8VHC8_9MAGN
MTERNLISVLEAEECAFLDLNSTQVGYCCRLLLMTISDKSFAESTGYDRAKELKAGIEKIPEIFILPKDDVIEELCCQGNEFQVPVIALKEFIMMVSNDKFKCVGHRALASRAGPRVSVAWCFTGSVKRLYSPTKKLISEGSAPLYKSLYGT